MSSKNILASKKSKVIAASIGILGLFGIIGAANPDQPASTSQQSAIPKASITCIDTPLAFKEETQETTSLHQGVSIAVKEGVAGKEKICKNDSSGRITERTVTLQPINKITLLGTTELPAGYDGKYNEESVKTEYANHGRLLSNHFGTYTAPVPVVAPATQQRQNTSAPTESTSQAQSSAYYANCSQARAAGVTPIYRGQPGYAAKLDRDNDGIACE